MTQTMLKIKYSEMSNIYPVSSGVPYVMWIRHKTGREKNRIRVKVSVPQENKFLSFSVSDSPQILSKTNISKTDISLIKSWIVINKDVLIQFWNAELDTVQFSKKIKRVK